MKLTIAIILASIPFIVVHAQELEPRAYANLPKGTNAIAVVFGLSRGNVLSDPSLPIKNFKITGLHLGLGYVRTFALGEKLARVQLTIPYSDLLGKLQIHGRDTSGSRTGFGDARIRLGVNLIGSKALAPKDFRRFEQSTIMGVSLIISAPTGLYYKDKLINLGSNRWAFKPEIGVSKRFKRVYAEAYTGIWFYADNREYLTNKVLEQEPVLSIQGHINYYFKNQMWVGLNLNWFTGGKTIVDNEEKGNLEDNWRIGATWSFPIAKQQSIKLQFHIGAYSTSSYNYNIWTIGYQYVFF